MPWKLQEMSYLCTFNILSWWDFIDLINVSKVKLNILLQAWNKTNWIFDITSRQNEYHTSVSEVFIGSVIHLTYLFLSPLWIPLWSPCEVFMPDIHPVYLDLRTAQYHGESLGNNPLPPTPTNHPPQFAIIHMLYLLKSYLDSPYRLIYYQTRLMFMKTS